MKFIHPMLVSLALILSLGCNSQKVPNNSKPITHELWDALLKKHVTLDGRVNYEGFKKDQSQLNAYLDLLRKGHPNKENWSREERLAYWINAYNAFTVDLIVRNYPCKTIKDLGGAIYKVNTPWDIRFITIQGITYDLNNIEHDILRKEFDEPRIHFAINCASVSCPVLRNEAYSAEKINSQLDSAAKTFINDPSRNKISTDSAELSKIFTWFKGDFTKKETLASFINRYSNTKISEKTQINYLDYNWLLNE
jgi:hypothetical protein